MPGVGPKTAERLEVMGIRTVAELARAPDEQVVTTLGSRNGPALAIPCERARRRALVETGRAPKSESRETTFDVDVDDQEELHHHLDRLADSLCERMGRNGYRGRTVTLKIRLRPFRTFTRSRTLPSPTADRELIRGTAHELLDAFERDAPVRLLGVGLSGLVAEQAEAESGAAKLHVRLSYFGAEHTCRCCRSRAFV